VNSHGVVIFDNAGRVKSGILILPCGKAGKGGKTGKIPQKAGMLACLRLYTDSIRDSI